MRIKKYLKPINIVLFIVIGIILFGQGSYFFYFNGGFSSSHIEWAEFGSFFGGFVGALLSFINILFVIQTLNNQNDQLKLMRDEIENENLEKVDKKKKEILFYYKKVFNESIQQKNIIKDAFQTGNNTGDQVFNKCIHEIFSYLKDTDEVKRKGFDYAASREEDNKKSIIERVTRYISILNIIANTIKEIDESELEQIEKDEFISRYNLLLSDYELKYLVICKSIKEIHNIIKYVDKALGEYSIITINDLKNNNETNIRNIGVSKGILTFTI